MNKEISQPIVIESEHGRQVVVGSGSTPSLSVLGDFVDTKAYQLFVDLCEFCRAARVVGVCWGATGVGKTLAARRVCQWDIIEPRLPRYGVLQGGPMPEGLMLRAAFYTPPATITPKRLEQDIALLRWEVQSLYDIASGKQEQVLPMSGFIRSDQLDLLIIDEANRLRPDEFEVLRDVFDRGQMGMVLVGWPGIDRKVRALSQLAGRVGMRYVFEGLQEQEVLQLLQQYVQGRAVEMTPQVASAIIERAKGSFQKVRVLLLQVEYLLRINQLSEVTLGVVDLACEQVY